MNSRFDLHIALPLEFAKEDAREYARALSARGERCIRERDGSVSRSFRSVNMAAAMCHESLRRLTRSAKAWLLHFPEAVP